VKKYLPSYFKDNLLDHLSRLRQRSLSIKEYMTKFDDLTVRCDVSEYSDSLFLGFALA